MNPILKKASYPSAILLAALLTSFGQNHRNHFSSAQTFQSALPSQAKYQYSLDAKEEQTGWQPYGHAQNVTLTGTDSDEDGLENRFDANNSSIECTSHRLVQYHFLHNLSYINSNKGFNLYEKNFLIVKTFHKGLRWLKNR